MTKAEMKLKGFGESPNRCVSIFWSYSLVAEPVILDHIAGVRFSIGLPILDTSPDMGGQNGKTPITLIMI
jgi:hypothetical protein